MNIGGCCICLSPFKATEVATLKNCPHTFHHKCILRAVQENGECPLCRRSASSHDVKRLCIDTPTPDGNYSQYAVNNAMAVLDTVVKDKGEGGEQRQLLQETLMVSGEAHGSVMMTPVSPHFITETQGLIAVIEGEQNARKVIDWTPMKKLIAAGGIAVLVALLVWLCWMYWPVIVPMATRAAGFILRTIRSLGTFCQQHFPEIAVAALTMVGISSVAKIEGEN